MRRDLCSFAGRDWTERVSSSGAAIVVRARRVGRSEWLIDAGPIIAALSLWAAALELVDLDDIDEFGLVSALPCTYYLAASVLTVGFAVALARKRPVWLLAAYVATLVVLLHATAPLLYGTPRYSWAWKHVGIVDFILRHGTTDPNAIYLSANHNWPGFFILVAQLLQLCGVRSALGLATWAPVLFQFLHFLILPILYRSFTRNHGLIWFSVWLFYIANWVGQEYFSPQAFGFFLYILLLAAALRWFRQEPRRPATTLSSRMLLRWYAEEQRTARRIGPAVTSSVLQRGALVAALLSIMLALAVSHQLSPLIATIALGLLSAAGVCAGWNLTAIMGLATVGWIVFGASAFVGQNLVDVLIEFGDVLSNSEATMVNLQEVSPAQALVSLISRGLSAGIVVLAGLGMVRRFLLGQPILPVALLCAAPLVLASATSYGGEVLFRVYLFALPFLAFFAGSLLLPRPRRSRPLSTGLAVSTVGLACVAAFFVAYFGKDAQYRFSDDEIAAASYLYQHAPPGSLIIEGDRNYPSQFLHYEYFTYVAIAREDAQSQEKILQNPAIVFDEWAANANYTATYIILTRSQAAMIDAIGTMPGGSLTTIEQALRRSDDFDLVYDSIDAVLFSWNRRPSGSS